jgi:uncharacterized 2Fe-2S/4Fe-4S cluster protein (DUF4445 family)
MTPWIQTLELPAPSLQNNTADADRVIGNLKTRLGTGHVDIDLRLLKRLPALLRQSRFKVRCLVFQDRCGWRLIEVASSDDPGTFAGLAVDLGTSRIVLRLLALDSGRVLGEAAFENPQITVGYDILTRIHYACQAEGLTALTGLLITGLNREISGLCRSLGMSPSQIYFVSAAGNTAMTHLFLGLDPHWLIREPYIPAVNTPPVLRADQIGLEIHPAAAVFVFPNVGSYFGGDVVAGILYSGLHRSEDTMMLVDVGTNAEVVAGNRNWLIACAGAAGPALESGVTRMGMMAGPGAIDRVRISPRTREFDIQTIDNLPPKGICGSGVIDLAAQLFLCGMIDNRGKLVSSACGDRLLDADGMAHLIVVPADSSATGSALTFSQADMDSLIRSKAAMYTILETITTTVGISFSDLTSFFVAGTFGSFINPASAITIGMLPDLPLERFQSLGNSSIGGASRLLEGGVSLTEIDDVRNRITYLELNVNQEFMNRFSAAKFLPHTDAARFPSVAEWQETGLP